LRTDLFDYHLPPELIAQEPVTPRDASRLLVLPTAGPNGEMSRTAAMEHRAFRDLPEYLAAGDLLVLNQTRVLRARLLGRKTPAGGKVEALLLRPLAGPADVGPRAWDESWDWETLVRPGRRLPPGAGLAFPAEGEPRLLGRVTGRTPSGGRTISFQPARSGETFGQVVEALGQVPLPPYITRPLVDAERYQTIFAAVKGSAAAPTAGLHFTPEVFSALQAKGVRRAMVTLHIGLDTFRPVREEAVESHRMHSEWYEVPLQTAEAVAQCRGRGGRVVACGTTVVRTLEAAADPARPGLVRAGSGETNLFIYPGYRFRVVDLVLTNFHLPRSTLLMLVSAFGGPERILETYREAARLRYRFYSFGDAMLIFPATSAKEGLS
jgi:S-adenosylmethionine:tRNA ribosyltransferase-isomerase